MGDSNERFETRQRKLFGFFDLKEEVIFMRTSGKDNERVEVKSAQSKVGKAVWTSVSAFANTAGGVILFGLDENNDFQPVAEFSPSATQDSLLSSLSENPNSTPAVNPVPRYSIETTAWDGRPILALHIEAIRDDPRLQTQMPCFVHAQGLKNGSYKRVGDQDQRLNSYEIYSLQNQFRNDESDNAINEDASIGDLDEEAIRNMIARMTKQGSRVAADTTSREEILQRIGVMRGEHPTLAGLLVLGRYPQQFYPQLFIDVVVHPAAQKSASVSGARFLDRRHCDGPLHVAIDDAVSATMKALRVRYREVNGKVIEEPEIPEIAVREAITNAVMHRDYGMYQRGQQVAVDIYPDRVEIISPGGLWADRTVDNIDEGRSVSRNQRLASLLSQVIAADNYQVAQNQGSGVPRMLTAMQHQGLVPGFVDEISSFTVTLPRFGLIDQEHQNLLARIGPGENRTQDIALSLAHDLGAVSPQILRQHLGVDSDDARRELRILAAKERLIELTPDSFRLKPAVELTELQNEILQVLSPEREHSAREIADLIGRAVSTVRPHINGLVELGYVKPTAPPTSRNRAYLLNL